VDFKVSIIVPAFNEENQIESLLQSLINQNFIHKYEIIIVDNQSTDNTVKKAESFKIKHKVKDLKIITSIGKLGKVRNDGILNSSGEWIAFIDADEIADPNWLSELMKKTDNYDIVIGAIHLTNPDINFITKFFDLLRIKRIEILKKSSVIKAVGTGNLLVNRRIFNKGILFDNNFPTSEDGDFSYQLFKKGFKFGFNDKAIIFHKIPESFRQLYYYQKKNIIGGLLIFLKHPDRNNIIRMFTDVFYWISPNFLRVYRRNKIISKLNFIFMGTIMTIIALNCYLNPIILFRLKKKISRPK